MIKCIKCGDVGAIAKAGIIRGQQRYYCGHCDYYFTFPNSSKASNQGLKKHQTTIFDIAKELRISKSTVSRALHMHSDINENTRNAVLDIAKKLDYHPNLLAYGLAKGKSLTVGIIVPEFINSFFPYVIIGAQEVANPIGYHILVCQSNESYKIEVENTNVLMASRVDGLLVSLTGETPNVEHFKKFERAGTPVVYFNRVPADDNASKVIVDDYDGAFRGVEHLIQNGCKRIAHIAGPQNLLISRNRLQGYLDALKYYNMTADENLIKAYDLKPENSHECAKYFFSLENRPDGLFAVNDPAAIAAMLAAKEYGVQIPDALAVVGFSNEPVSALIEPGLTTLAQPMKAIGSAAINLLFGQMNSSEECFTPVTLVLKTELIVRKSSQRNACHWTDPPADRAEKKG
ncbi:MAG: LacI family transcriptional regulator [Candidatus Nephrothrix sp. EaCA]|nr:MAG: LacI family transcriptional regulator [Candidatus Nephrothrix sp. EaCA]